MKFSLTATIPTVQYGNLQPSIEVEADTFEEAQKIAMPQIQQIWNSVCEQGKELVIRDVPTVALAQPGKLMTCSFSNEQLSISPDHTYTDAEGNVYESGSRFAHKFTYPFDKGAILPRYAAKVGVDPEEIANYWEAKGDASTTFGKALHQALETYGKFVNLATKLEKPLGIHGALLPAVEAFFTPERLKEDAMYEVFVVDKNGKRCGQIDRLVITGDKECIIEDYKTNRDLNKQGSPKFLKAPYDTVPNSPLGEYTLQLNFYRAIMEALGWTVKSMRIHYFGEAVDGTPNTWEVIPVERVEI